MPLAGVGVTEVAQGLEVLEELLGDGGEMLAAADAIEVAEHALARAGDDGAAVLVHDSHGLEVIEVAQELLAIEVRQGPTLLRFQKTPSGRGIELTSIIFRGEGTCQGRSRVF